MKRIFCGLLVLFLCSSAFGQVFNELDLAFFGRNVTDWATRVVNNGGAMPSQNTIACMETLRTTLIAQGKTNKIYSLCVFVPDSVIAAATPLFLHQGYPMWTNNFVSGDLTIEGLKGDGTSKAMDTGVKGKDGDGSTALTGNSRGLAFLVTEADGTNFMFMGQRDEIGGDTLQMLQLAGNGNSAFYINNTATVFVETNDYARIGFVSGQLAISGGTTNCQIFFANPLEPHKLIKTFTVLAEGSTTPTSTENTMSVFAYTWDGTNYPASFSSRRASFAAVTDGLTQTESSNLWWSVKTCRECLGGGTGDPIVEWNRRIVVAGGADISTTTSNDTRTFYSELETDGLLNKFVFVNTYPPDSLTATRTPVIWHGGFSTWANIAFGETNLTVNGLTGNGTTKYLGTGINVSSTAIGGFTDASAGLSVLIYNTPADANMFNIATAGSGVNGLFAVGNQVGLAVFYCWAFTTVNTTHLIRAAPNAGWEGYLSGNRTAANAIRLDWVTNQVHNIATNGTGANGSLNNAMTNLFAHANASAASAPLNISDQTVSYISMHSGLTQTESSNQWWRVANLRTNYGGGVP